jgi:hypothetical protein
MTGLQSGTPAQALAPQNYSNSSQDGVFQDASGSSTFQSTPSTSQTLQTNSANSLQVVGPAQTSQVLGIDTVALNREASKESSNNLVMPMVFLALISFATFLFFWRWLSGLRFESEVIHDESDEDK